MPSNWLASRLHSSDHPFYRVGSIAWLTFCNLILLPRAHLARDLLSFRLCLNSLPFVQVAWVLVGTGILLLYDSTFAPYAFQISPAKGIVNLSHRVRSGQLGMSGEYG